MFDENGHLQQYVGVEPGSEVELPDGWTLRDAEGAIVEFDDEDDFITFAEHFTAEVKAASGTLLVLSVIEPIRMPERGDVLKVTRPIPRP